MRLDGESVTTRLWQKIDKDGPVPTHCPELGPCWIWTGFRNRDGYGRMSLGGRGEGMALVHRITWTLSNGEIGGGIKILHRCDNPPCVNPKHLFAGTQADNLADMDEKGRRRSVPTTGEEHYNAILTAEMVRDIRAVYDSTVNRYGVITMLAKKHGVTADAVGSAARRRSWKDI